MKRRRKKRPDSLCRLENVRKKNGRNSEKRGKPVLDAPKQERKRDQQVKPFAEFFDIPTSVTLEKEVCCYCKSTTEHASNPGQDL
ncbi:hypothetical protein OUZ56_008931 [Daphnia magna]|uniref:Uncharacterized protein n=1 Tax=Daphnia magna TaxID=35525 RepID=A0ABR0AEH6_9CRUS|nr:hypothetical protein OUZ56_008931 [Daphnia magna]